MSPEQIASIKSKPHGPDVAALIAEVERLGSQSASPIAGTIAAWWTGCTQFIEREAGHSVLAILLILTAVRLADPQTRAAAAHDVLVFSLSMLAKGMGTQQQTK